MKIWAVIWFVLMASVKFMVAPPIGFMANLNYWQTVLGMFVGGMIGVLTFYYTAHYFIERSARKLAEQIAKSRDGEVKAPKIFSRWNKFIVRLRRKFGLYGIVFIALPFVSLPIEGILCAKFFRHEKRIVPLLTVSVLIWAFVLTSIYYLFYDSLKGIL